MLKILFKTHEVKSSALKIPYLIALTGFSEPNKDFDFRNEFTKTIIVFLN